MNPDTNHKSTLLYVGNKLSHCGFTPGVIETLGPLLEAEGYKVFYAGTFKNKILRLLEMLFKTLTTGRKVDYILIDTYSTSAFWYAYMAGRVAKLVRTKYIPILHGGSLPDRLVRSKRSCDRLFKNSYANVAVSGYLRYEFEKAGYSTVVIPNSIDISLYPFKKREYPRAKLLWVRSFHRQYNPNMAAVVLSELLKNHPDAELCMVGPDKDGSMNEFKTFINSIGIAKHVTITGKLSKEEWIKLSENYDFFINTTNVDNTPVSVIEAMALGMIIVTTDAGGIPYLVSNEKDAIVVERDKSSTMAQKINGLIDTSLKSVNFSMNARIKAESFDSKNIIKPWKEILV